MMTPSTPSQSSNAPREALFAGKLFVLSSDGQHLMMCDAPMPAEGATMRMITTLAVQVHGAFIVAQTGRWLLVGGWSEHRHLRQTFFDDSTERDANAASMADLGIPVLSIDEANANLREAALPLNSITADERAEQAAALRYAQREAGK
jgi:hypothetical protein